MSKIINFETSIKNENHKIVLTEVEQVRSERRISQGRKLGWTISAF